MEALFEYTSLMPKEERTITIRVRSVYGRTRYFPESETAHTFALLMNRKTFEPEHLKLIKALGFEITLKQEELILE